MDEVARKSIQELVLSCDGVKAANWDNDHALTLNLQIDVHLTQDCEEAGVSDLGVRAIEPVAMVFNDRYPFVAPRIVLRDDFPRSFPHINPSLKEVLPCIYEGDLSELLQQSGLAMIIFQLATWLRKAAANDLMDLEQGWEWTRNDDCEGVLKGHFNILRDLVRAKPYRAKFYATALSDYPNGHFAAVLSLDAERKSDGIPCFIYAASQEKKIAFYHPNQITNVEGLKKFFATHIGENVIKDALDEMAKDKVHGRFIAIALVRRPCNLINLDTNIEVLPFLVNIRRTGKKRVALDSSVTLLAAADLCSPMLMRRVSGHRPTHIRQLVQLGCGSLGSKISLHLVRNGFNNICFVDHDLLWAHNMARHALIWNYRDSLKSVAMMAFASAFATDCSCEYDYMKVVTKASSADVIIDSTASLAVRNRLTLDDVPARIIHTALYGKMEHQCGICFIEGADRNPRVDDICFHFMRANVLDDIGAVDYTVNNLERYTYGQGCSSLTMKVDDSTISLLAAGMAHRVQKYIDSGFPDTGDCGYGRTEDGESVRWECIDMGKTIVLPGVRDDGYQVRVLSCAKDEMDRLAESAHENETGGYLVGAIVRNTKTITVVACLPPPSDSRATPGEFVLGVDGMKKAEATINGKSNGVLGVIGTWHTHPMGGHASITDWDTYGKIFKKRKCPTLCLIWVPTGIECLPEIKRR